MTPTSASIFIPSDKIAKSFLVLAMSYLLIGLIFGIIGGFQYILPGFLKEQLSFQKSRPLHVYLVIIWIFTAAQAGIYYYLPRITQKNFYWLSGIWIHFFIQLTASVLIVFSFLAGKFGGREYLEFPPWIAAFIIASWIPFAVNFFLILRGGFKNAPVYIWMWATGIIFFLVTLSESYLWLFDFFRNNMIRDITVQWKATGSMVGSWNMLVYGTGIYVMEKLSGNNQISRSPLSFFFYFIGLTNLMFNWGHHTYIVPAEPWVKTVAYFISMTELILLGNIIWQWRKTLSDAKKNFYQIPYRLLSFSDGWIFLNLILAIAISVPALNYYTHGTHITVAHAMGTTIGINTMILFASVYYILKENYSNTFVKREKILGYSINFTNISLIVFWISLLGSGFVKIAGRLNKKSFYNIMLESQPWFKIFSFSGIFILVGLLAGIYLAFIIIYNRNNQQRQV